MKIEYRRINLSRASLLIADKANEIIHDYETQGYKLTLRQLYYQFVSRDIIPNKDSEYKRLGSIINDARMAGIIDWDSIEDRTRGLKARTHWDSPAEILESVARSYHIDMWDNQQTRVEVWIEKDALVGVIENTCRLYDVPFLSCRGYLSQSEMWAAGQRIEKYIRNDQNVIVLYLGDHDPSGLDMSRDIRDRLLTFIGQSLLDRGVVDEEGFEVRRIGLTMAQVKKYNPPPNPAKQTDSRFSGYIEKYGGKSWELDALSPEVINALISKHVAELVDKNEWAKRELLLKEQRGFLKNLVKKAPQNGDRT